MTFFAGINIIERQICCAGVAEWQTRMFKGHVRKSVGSTPTARTKEKTALLLVFEQAFRSPKNALRIFWNKEETNEW